MIDPREEALFEVALDQPPATRTAYLRDACADDPDLRTRVEALLRQHDSAVGVLDHDPAGLDLSTSAHAVGEAIGPYILVEELGVGGMGVVYRAEQHTPVRRTVALKVIKPGMDTRSIIARFEGERQALALLDHPTITKVLDAGATAQGRPYFVMELCHGVDITTYAQEHDLPISARLQLFARVCHGVEHAHQKGILHRDLKPSNVLVAPPATGDRELPTPKIIDFGVAKALTAPLAGETLVTVHGQVIGTPAYTSPEQADNGLDVDTRADVYSLGVLLFELLTDTTPTAALDIPRADVLDAVRTIDAPAPSQVLRRMETPPVDPRAVRGELDWIVARALEKERTRRYQSAADLARDIAAHLEGAPVEAAAPTLGYRVRKTVARHKVAALSATAIGLVLLVATIVSTTLAWRLDDSLEDVRKERDRAVEAERKLAALEREQRNRAAVYRGLARYAGTTVAEQLGDLQRTFAAIEMPEGFVPPEFQEGSIGDAQFPIVVEGMPHSTEVGRILDFIHTLDGLELFGEGEFRPTTSIHIGVTGFGGFENLDHFDFTGELDAESLGEILPKGALSLVLEEVERAVAQWGNAVVSEGGVSEGEHLLDDVIDTIERGGGSE